MKVINSTEKINSFGGVNMVDERISNAGISQLIDDHLGSRSPQAEYTYSDVFKSLWHITLCGGDCAEDVNENLKETLRGLKNTNVSSADTLLRVEKQLATEKETYVSDSQTIHEFNVNMPLNRLMVRMLVHLNMLKPDDDDVVFDYDNQFIATEKHDAKRSYKHADGYFPGIATINNMPVYIENRNGNSNVKYKQAETLQRGYGLLQENGISIKRSRMDCGSFAKDIVDVVAQNSGLFYIRAQRCESLTEQIRQITDWQTVRIGHIYHQVASIEYTPFGGTKTYRYVISRQPKKSVQLDCFTGDAFTYRAIMTNDMHMGDQQVIEFYNQRGAEERVFDVMNNDFNWANLPFSFLEENTVFMIIMAMCKNVYQFLVGSISKKLDFIEPNFRLKKFIFRFMAVPAKCLPAAGRDTQGQTAHIEAIYH